MFASFSAIDMWNQVILDRGSCLLHGGTFGNIPALRPLDAQQHASLHDTPTLTLRIRGEGADLLRSSSLGRKTSLRR